MAILPQTSVSLTPALAVAGMIADAGFDRLCKAGALDVAADAGWFVCKGATAAVAGPVATETIKLPTTGTDVTGAAARGFLLYRPIHQIPAGQTTQYIATDYVNYLQQGRIWVVSAEQMAVDDPVFVIHAATNRGKVRNDADTANASQLPAARVVEVASATLCCVEINIP